MHSLVQKSHSPPALNNRENPAAILTTSFFWLICKGGFGSAPGFVIYDETAADNRNGEAENREKETEDKENM